MTNLPSTRATGFTLIELMIVVVIIAILAAVAYPSYQQHLLKSRRNDCQGILARAASALERNRAVTGNYGTLPNDLKQCPASGEQSYSITQTTPSGGAAATAFLLTAIPVGKQTADQCGNLTLAHTGVKGTSKGNAADCWR